MTPQELLELKIDEAWADYVLLHKEEIDSGYDDAMDGFERKEAEGYALGMEYAYRIIFDKPYETKTPSFDPYEYEDSNE